MFWARGIILFVRGIAKNVRLQIHIIFDAIKKVKWRARDAILGCWNTAQWLPESLVVSQKPKRHFLQKYYFDLFVNAWPQQQLTHFVKLFIWNGPRFRRGPPRADVIKLQLPICGQNPISAIAKTTLIVLFVSEILEITGLAHVGKLFVLAQLDLPIVDGDEVGTRQGGPGDSPISNCKTRKGSPHRNPKTRYATFGACHFFGKIDMKERPSGASATFCANFQNALGLQLYPTINWTRLSSTPWGKISSKSVWICRALIAKSCATACKMGFAANAVEHFLKQYFRFSNILSGILFSIFLRSRTFKTSRFPTSMSSSSDEKWFKNAIIRQHAFTWDLPVVGLRVQLQSIRLAVQTHVEKGIFPRKRGGCLWSSASGGSTAPPPRGSTGSAAPSGTPRWGRGSWRPWARSAPASFSAPRSRTGPPPWIWARGSPGRSQVKACWRIIAFLNIFRHWKSSWTWGIATFWKFWTAKICWRGCPTKCSRTWNIVSKNAPPHLPRSPSCTRLRRILRWARRQIQTLLDEILPQELMKDAFNLLLDKVGRPRAFWKFAQKVADAPEGRSFISILPKKWQAPKVA